MPFFLFLDYFTVGYKLNFHYEIQMYHQPLIYSWHNKQEVKYLQFSRLHSYCAVNEESHSIGYEWEVQRIKAQKMIALGYLCNIAPFFQDNVSKD